MDILGDKVCWVFAFIIAALIKYIQVKNKKTLMYINAKQKYHQIEIEKNKSNPDASAHFAAESFHRISWTSLEELKKDMGLN